MKKVVLTLYKAIVCLLLVSAIVFVSIIISKKDELVTEHITLKYFERSMNYYDKDNLKEFVAMSENDILYNNAINSYEVYHNDTIDYYRFKILDYEAFGNGKYQCYFNLKGVPTCDISHEGKYMNYLIKTATTYKTESGKRQTIYEKGLVVFVKDGSNGNLFEWKLVRYERDSNI